MQFDTIKVGDTLIYSMCPDASDQSYLVIILVVSRIYVPNNTVTPRVEIVETKDTESGYSISFCRSEWQCLINNNLIQYLHVPTKNDSPSTSPGEKMTDLLKNLPDGSKIQVQWVNDKKYDWFDATVKRTDAEVGYVREDGFTALMTLGSWSALVEAGRIRLVLPAYKVGDLVTAYGRTDAITYISEEFVSLGDMSFTKGDFEDGLQFGYATITEATEEAPREEALVITEEMRANIVAGVFYLLEHGSIEIPAEVVHKSLKDLNLGIPEDLYENYSLKISFVRNQEVAATIDAELLQRSGPLGTMCSEADSLDPAKASCQ